MKLKDIPCIKDQAYFIVVGLNGSWLYNALYPHITQEEFCKKIVEEFEGDYGLEVETEWGMCRSNAAIQEIIDESYEEILDYRAKKALKKAAVL